MAISSLCDSYFIPILAESLLFPSIPVGYSTFNPRLESGHVLSRLGWHCAILQCHRVTVAQSYSLVNPYIQGVQCA